MNNRHNLDENIVIRRILLQDLPKVKHLYAKLGKDAIWLENSTLEFLIKSAELWACVNNGTVITCGGICGPNSNLELANLLKVQKTPFYSGITLLPFAGENKALSYLLSFLNCRIAGKYNGKNYELVLPAKTGAQYLCTCLKSDMVLVAMRPLFHLRVCYVLCLKAHVQVDMQNTITVNLADSLSLSRYLEHGFCAIKEDNKNITLAQIVKSC